MDFQDIEVLGISPTLFQIKKKSGSSNSKEVLAWLDANPNYEFSARPPNDRWSDSQHFGPNPLHSTENLWIR